MDGAWMFAVAGQHFKVNNDFINAPNGVPPQYFTTVSKKQSLKHMYNNMKLQ